MQNDGYPFLSLWQNELRHHCVLLPSLYGMNNCVFLFEYFKFQYNIEPQTVLSSPDFLLLTQNSNYTIPLTVEDVRTTIMRFAQNTSFGKYKAIVIEKIDEASTSAVNALLKIIEEPPKDTRFYLIYSNLNSVLETVRSRSIVVRENIVHENDFNIIANLLSITKDFHIFTEAGYDFEAYKTLVEVINWDFNEIYKKLQSKVDDETYKAIMFHVEHVLKKYLQNPLSFIEFDKISSLLEKITVLQKLETGLNINKQSILIQLTEETHALVG